MSFTPNTRNVYTRDAPIIGRLPIIGIGPLVRWYRPIVVYTIGKQVVFLLPK